MEAEDAEVLWFHNGEQIDITNSQKFEIVKIGKKRKLVLKCATLSDSGEISVKTNTQTSSCQLNVQCENDIIKGLPAKMTVLEREEVSFQIQLRDPNAPVNLILNQQHVVSEDSRLMSKNLGEGSHMVILKGVEMTDFKLEIQTPSNRDGKTLSSESNMTVIKGEEVPELGECGPVFGIADQHCNWTLPYAVQGQPQSLLEVIVLKDGKELVIGTDINLDMNHDQINLSVINPTRDKSGVYTVVLRNAQGGKCLSKPG